MSKRKRRQRVDSSDNYVVVGCVEFVTSLERDQYGYSDGWDYPEEISLIYKKDSSDLMYFKQDGKMKILYDYNVKNKYTIEEAREVHPELFL